jgi:hypothetical protein
MSPAPQKSTSNPIPAVEHASKPHPSYKNKKPRTFNKITDLKFFVTTVHNNCSARDWDRIRILEEIPRSGIQMSALT